MIKFKKQDKPYVPSIGDMVYCSCEKTHKRNKKDWNHSLCEYIHSEFQKEYLEDFLPVTIPWFRHQSYNAWNNLHMFGVEDIRKHFEYECPWTGNTYYWFYPIWMLMKNPDEFEKMPGDGFFFDKEWTLSQYFDFKEDSFPYDSRGNIKGTFMIDDVGESMMGHGYMDCILPNDGDSDIKEFLIELDNGNFVLGKGFVWYNK